MTKQLITITDPPSAASEAFRSLYINLTFSGQENPPRTLLVTSATQDEGKSTALANLAVVAAQMGQKVILVDCDLRQPQQHTIFGLNNSRGVGTLMEPEVGIADSLQAVADVPGLQIMAAGPQPPSPAQILASRRMEELIHTLTDQADLVLFDSPPVLAVSDASVLATRVDSVMLVIKAGQTKRDHARRAKESLEKVNANIIGAVLNNAAGDAALQGYAR